MQYVYFTKTRQNEPMASVGAGVRWPLARKVFLRTEFRDFITPFPEQVITPAMGATLKGDWLHNLVPMAGIGCVF
jgi:hypothetical protein